MGYYLGKGQDGTTIPLRHNTAGTRGGGGTSSLASLLTASPAGHTQADPGQESIEPESGEPGLRSIRPHHAYRETSRAWRNAPSDTPRADMPSSDDYSELGEWEWPAEMRGLYSLLSSRAGELLGMTPGFSQEAIDTMFGRDFEKIRAMEHGTREQVQNELAAQGMLNTGTGLDALIRTAWETEKNVGGAKENVFLANEAQKRQDLELYNTLAKDLFGQLSEYNMIEETLNAARRGEANNALAMLLQYYMMAQGSQGG